MVIEMCSSHHTVYPNGNRVFNFSSLLVLIVIGYSILCSRTVLIVIEQFSLVPLHLRRRFQIQMSTSCHSTAESEEAMRNLKI